MDKLRSKTIIIKIDNNNIHFNPNLSIPVRNSNLPMDHMKFHYHEDIYWLIELIKYSENRKCLYAKVLDYTIEIESNPSFAEQTPKKIISRVEFDKLNWKKLEPLLSNYTFIKLSEILYNHNNNNLRETNNLNADSIKSFNQSTYQIPEKLTDQPEVQINPIATNLQYKFSVKFQDSHFFDGYVIFKKSIKKIGTQLEFKIQNVNILEEFDNIKMWFAKKLNTKKFDVTVTITIKDNIITKIMAVSPQIEMITTDIISSVKYDRTIALTKPPKSSNPDKSLYTTEDIFKILDPEVREGNIFGQTGIDIIKFLSQTYQVRNFKQLEFLSVSKQNTSSKLHYTLNPLFGFLFFVEGNLKYHFIWELLQSHATYIWSIEKENHEIASLYNKLEKIINEIRLIGRDHYKKTYDEKDPKYGFTFHLLEHQNISTNIDDGFSKWSSKLEGLLI